MYIVRHAHLSPQLIARLAEVQRDVLGPEHLVTTERAVKKHGEWSGGIAFERVEELKGVKGTRCYTVGPSTQHARSLTSPVAGGKMPDAGLTPALKLRQNIVAVRLHLRSSLLVIYL